MGQMSSTVQCSEINGETICKRKSSSCAGQYIISNGSCLNPRKVFSQDNKKFVKWMNPRTAISLNDCTMSGI